MNKAIDETRKEDNSNWLMSDMPERKRLNCKSSKYAQTDFGPAGGFLD
jgi:hypothetical protein